MISLQIFFKIFRDSLSETFSQLYSTFVYIQDHSRMSFGKLGCKFTDLFRESRIACQHKYYTSLALYQRVVTPSLACKCNHTWSSGIERPLRILRISGDPAKVRGMRRKGQGVPWSYMALARVTALSRSRKPCSRSYYCNTVLRSCWLYLSLVETRRRYLRESRSSNVVLRQLPFDQARILACVA